MSDETRRRPGDSGTTPEGARTPRIPRPRQEPPPLAHRHPGVPADATPVYPLPGGWPDPDLDDACGTAEAGPQPPVLSRWRRLALILAMVALTAAALLVLRAFLGIAAADPGPHRPPAATCHTTSPGPA